MPIDDFKTLPPEPLPIEESPFPSRASYDSQPPSSHAGSTYPIAPPSARGRGAATIVETRFAVPERIGKYRIKELVGSGGMGEVYEALQEHPSRTVALKVMRANITSADSLRRFEYEAQLLANLRHPWIAQVYDAGTYLDPDTRAPRPYFVMEFIPGARPLTEHADLHRLSRRERLALFIQVCEAMGHAHQRGVIHRDLKPANILVDNTGAPKVIDFGIARSSDTNSTVIESNDDRNLRRIVGTPEYMPPEQCSGDPTDLDVRADVYALGATLYELLTGRLPLDLATRTIDDSVRLIREKDPDPPSRHAEGVDADLDAIVLKCLRKSRDERYDTSLELASDIERSMHHEPILARRIGPVGKLVRWSRRNRALATALLVFTLILSITTIVLVSRILMETKRANKNLVIAQENLQAAKENLALMRGLFSSLKPDEQAGGKVSVEHMIDAASDRLRTAPATLPATEANFREFLGEAYRGVGAYSKAIDQQTRVVEIREQILDDPSAELADSLHDLGAALWWNGDYTAAKKAYARSLDMRRALYPGDHVDVSTSMTHLAACALRQGEFAEAERLYSDVLAMRRRLFKSPDAEIAASLNNLAKCLQARGDLAGAEPLFRQAYDMITKVRGDSHLQTASAAHNLGLCLLDAGRDSEAHTLFEQALSIRTARLGATHHLASSSRLALARAAFRASPKPESIRAAVESLQNLEQKLPADHPEVAEANTAVGLMHSRVGEYDRAERYFRTALSISKDVRRATPWEAARARLNLAQCLQSLNHNDEAEPLLRSCVETARAPGAPAGLLDAAKESLAKLLESTNRVDEATKVRASRE